MAALEGGPDSRQAEPFGQFLTHQRHWLCTAANGFDADFSPYQSTRLNRYNAAPDLGKGYAATRVHHPSRRRDCVAARGTRPAPPQSALMPTNFTTLPHFS